MVSNSNDRLTYINVHKHTHSLFSTRGDFVPQETLGNECLETFLVVSGERGAATGI